MQRELAGVEDLDGQPAADLHLRLVERAVGARPGPRRPPPHGVRAVAVEDVERVDRVALGLGHLLAVGVGDDAGDRGVRHGSWPISKWDRTTVENSQVRMISCACGRMSIGKVRANRSGSRSQPQTICGESDDVAQVSMTSGSRGEAAGLVALVLGVARRAPATPGRPAAGPRSASSGRVVVDLALGVQRVPDRERHAEEPLPADQPVAVEPADPVLVAVPHVLGHPVRSPGRARGTSRAGPRRGRRCGCTTAGWSRSRAACRRSRRSWPSAGSATGSPSRSPDARSRVDDRGARRERRLAGELARTPTRPARRPTTAGCPAAAGRRGRPPSGPAAAARATR